MSNQGRTPSATLIAQTLGGAHDLSRVQVAFGINAVPSASFSFHPKTAAGKAQAQAALASEFAQLMGAMQREIFLTPASAEPGYTLNLKLKGTVTSDDSLTFKGFPAMPRQQVGGGSIGPSNVIVHRLSALARIMPFIYSKVNYGSIAPRDSGEFGELLAGINDVNIGKRIRAVIETTIEYFLYEIENDPAFESSQEYLLGLHKINATFLPAFYDILEASAETNMAELAALPREAQLFLNNWIHQTFCSSGQDIMAVIAAYCVGFNMMLVPSLEPEGPAARLLMRRYQFDDVQKLRAEVIGFQASLGDTAVPITGVMTLSQALLSRDYVDDFTPPQSPDEEPVPPSIYLLYPPKLGQGRILQDGGPPWLSSQLLPDDEPADSGASKTTETVETGFNIDESAQAYETRKKLLTQWDKALFDVVVAWARDVYMDAALGGTALELSIALTFSTQIELGRYYEVATEQGNVLFRGLLSNIVHEYSSQPPQVGTRLIFSHIQAPGFTLPGIE